MRPRSFCSIILVVLLSTVSTQAGERPDIVAHIGITAPTMHQSGLSADARDGLALGVGTRFAIGAGFSVAPEIWYLQKGFKEGALWGVMDLEMKANTVSIPLLVTYYFDAKRVQSRAFIGPAMDIVMTAEILRDHGDTWVDVADESESVYWSVVAGGGVRRHDLDLEIRYLHGMTKLTDFDYTEFTGVTAHGGHFGDGLDRTWVLSVGYWF